MRNQALLNTQALKEYQTHFFAGGWQKSFAAEHEMQLGKLYERTERLLRDELIFNDALDMEACEVPHSLSRYKWHEFPGEDSEWAYMLNRHGFLVDLAMMYRLTGKVQYVEKWKELLWSFINESDMDNVEHCLAWRVIDTGIRLTNWVKSLAYLDLEDLLTPAELGQLSYAIQQHIWFIRKHYVAKYDLSNWGVLAVSGIACVALLCPELVDEETAAWTWDKLTLQLSLQFYQDGIHWEQSPLYHHEVLNSFAYLLQLSEYLDVPLLPDLRINLSRIAFASYYYADQKDVLNALHDSDSAVFETVYDVYRYLGLLHDKHPQSEFAKLWVGAKYKVNSTALELPPPLFVGKESGFYAWKDAEIYASWFNGLHGSSHGHVAQGHFTLSVTGTPFFISTGRHTYTNHPLRLILKSEQSHNALHVERHPATQIKGSWSYDQLAQPIGHSVRMFEGGYVASLQWQGEYQDEGIYVIEREIIFLEEFKAFVLFDVYRGRLQMDLALHYNLAPGLLILTKNNNTICLQQGEKQLTFWSGTTHLDLEERECSLVYNQISQHQCLVSRRLARGTIEVFVTVVGIGADYTVQPLNAYQNEQPTPCSTIHGVRVMNAEQAYCDVYYTSADIVSGDKLCYSSSGQPFYGKLNLFNEKGQRLQLK